MKSKTINFISIGPCLRFSVVGSFDFNSVIHLHAGGQHEVQAF